MFGRRVLAGTSLMNLVPDALPNQRIEDLMIGDNQRSGGL